MTSRLPYVLLLVLAGCTAPMTGVLTPLPSRFEPVEFLPSERMPDLPLAMEADKTFQQSARDWPVVASAQKRVKFMLIWFPGRVDRTWRISWNQPATNLIRLGVFGSTNLLTPGWSKWSLLTNVPPTQTSVLWRTSEPWMFFTVVGYRL